MHTISTPPTKLPARADELVEVIAKWIAGDGTDATRVALADGIRERRYLPEDAPLENFPIAPAELRRPPRPVLAQAQEVVVQSSVAGGPAARVMTPGVRPDGSQYRLDVNRAMPGLPGRRWARPNAP